MADAKHDLISQVLRKALKNEFNVSNEEDIVFTGVNEASGSGVSDNFGGELKLISFVLTVRGQLEEQPHSYIVKSLPENPLVKDMLESVSIKCCFVLYIFIKIMYITIVCKYNLLEITCTL